MRWLLHTIVVCSQLFFAGTSLAAARPTIVPPRLVHYEAPTYPKKLLARGLRGAVVLQIVIGKDGSIGKVTVHTSAGPDFDAAAVAAAKKLRFSPATVGGKPAPVAIRYRFRFAPEMRIDRRGRSRGLGRYGRRSKERAPSGFSSLIGQVVERGTGRPVAGAIIYLPKLKRETVSEADGSFRFGLLPKGVHRLYLPGADFKPLRRKIKVQDGKTTEMTLRPERRSYVIYRATAEAPPAPGEMTRRSLTMEEIQRVPGVYGDAFKVVQNLPGVSRSVGGALVVRGSAPQDTQVMVEGLRVPLLYHFGGLYSVFNTDVLSGIDFLPGGYAVRYGRGTGGILAANLALPKTKDKWRGTIESNVFHTGFLLQAPIGESTWLTVAARRSYVDYVLDAVVPDGVLPFTRAPRYYDYQIKLDHIASPRTNMTLFVFGASDAVSTKVDEPPAAFPDARGDLDTSTDFHAFVGVLRHDGGQWTSRTMVGALAGFFNMSLGDQFRGEGVGLDATARQEFTFGKGPVQLRTGLDLSLRPYAIELLAPLFQTSGERGTTGGNPPSQGNAYLSSADKEILPGFWIDAVFRMHPRLEVVPGIRVDLFRGIDTGQTFTPRINARYRVRKGLTLKAATGLTSQPPQPPQVLPPFGTPGLLPQRSWETAAGVEWQITDAIDLDMSGFYKRLSGVIGVTPGLFPATRYHNDATGSIKGLELLLRHKSKGRFFGWLSYTLQRATRVDQPGGPERLFGWDQTHIMTAVGSWKLPGNFEAGFRFRLTSGNPYTPLSTAVYNEKTDSYTRALSTCSNCARLPAFHQLDVRLDRAFVFDRWMLRVYLDVQNVYNRENAEFIRYNFDASQHTFGVGLPIIPSLGLKAQF
ncbi:MAG: TonB-dependent receptor [Myxococcales bacterium]|nr:TonB-dependent receptor [Myxococcales bacterium]